MKTFAKTTMMLATTALMFGGMAFGQTKMEAVVPFAFTSGSNALPAGTYDIQVLNVLSGKQIVLFRNSAAHKAVMALGNSQYLDANKEPQPRLNFLCNDDGCALTGVWTPTQSFSYPATHHKGSGADRIATIAINAVKAD